jgi:NAD(P)-dependent dehydrogenase (short-subunit alcohol dehydrogenase family)
MDLKLRGKRALVTGSTVGIGFAIARGLARERAEVIVNGRTEQKVAEAVQRISSEVGSRAVGISADLGSAEGVARLVAEAGRVDVLVNNLGIFWPVPFLEISDEDWFRIFEVNVMSGVRLARELLPQI